MADDEKGKKPAPADGEQPAAKRPVKRDAAEAKARREAKVRQAAEEAEAAASEETEEEEDALEGTDSEDENGEGEADDGGDDDDSEDDDQEVGEPAPRRRSGGRRSRRSRRSAADEEDDDVEEERKRPPRPRPSLPADVKLALEQRKEVSARRPKFRRQEWFRYQRLGDAWRAPQGIQSKQRRHWKNHPDLVSIGFRGPKKARGLHPSGFREVLVENEKGLSGVDRKTEAVRIASSVGGRKREAIQRRARKMGIRVLNWR